MAGIQKTDTGTISSAIMSAPDVVIQRVSGNGLVDIVVPLNELWEITYIYVEYTASADVGSRWLEVDILNASGVLVCPSTTGVQPTASTTYKFLFSFSGFFGTSSNENYALGASPAGAYALPGFTLRSHDDAAIAVANDSQVFVVQYRRWVL